MSDTAARDFITRVERDEQFAADLDAIKADPEAVLAQVRAEGFDVTPAEIRAAVLDRYGAELSPEQLAAVAAGMSEQVAMGGVIGLGTLLTVGAAVVAATF